MAPFEYFEHKLTEGGCMARKQAMGEQARAALRLVVGGGGPAAAVLPAPARRPSSACNSMKAGGAQAALLAKLHEREIRQ